MTAPLSRPLDPAELFFWWVDQVSPAHLTMVVELAASVALAAVEAALARAVARHPMLGVRFLTVGRDVCFVAAHCGPTVRAAEAGLSAGALAEQELALRLVGDGPLVRATHSSGADGTTLALVLHHAVADGRTALAVLAEVVDDALGLSSPDVARRPSPSPLHSVLPARWPRDASAVRARSARLAGERARLIPGQPGRATGPARVIVGLLDPPAVGALRERCRREQTTVHAALAAALLLASCELSAGHGEALGLATPVDLRPTLDPPLPPVTPSLATGTVTTFHRVAGDRVAGETNPWALAREIGATVAARVAVGEAHLAYLVERLDRLPSTPAALPAVARGLAARPAASVMSNLGVLPSFGAGQVRRLLCALRPLPHQPCFVVATTREGRLELTLVHDESRLPGDVARQLADRLIGGLVRVAASSVGVRPVNMAK
jgi:hypothetical protein